MIRLVRSLLERLCRIFARTGLPVVLLLALLVAQADRQRFFLFESANELAYRVVFDQKVAWSSIPEQTVLVVAADRRLDDRRVVDRLARELESLGARAIGAVVPIAESRSDDLKKGAADWIAPARHDGSELFLPVPFDRTGVVSRYPYRRSGRVPIPSLASLLAERAGRGVPWRHGPPSFRINYRAGVDSLPHVSAEQVLSGQITSELIAGRVVLLGLRWNAAQGGVIVPTVNDRPMSPLEYHGQAVNTLLAGRAIHDLPAGARVCLLTLVSLAAGLLFRRVPARSAVLCAALGVLLFASASMAVLLWADCWVPLGSLISCLLLALPVTVDYRLRQASQTWQYVCQRLSLARAQLQLIVGTDDALDPWAAAIHLAEQLLPVDQAALLLLPKKSERLRLVYPRDSNAGQQPANDRIVERRRDPRRAPFLEPLATRTLSRIDQQRPFFAVRQGEAQYLIPLVDDGRPFGAMILAISEQSASQINEFDEYLRHLGDQVTALIVQHECNEYAGKLPWYRRLLETFEQRAQQQVRRWIDEVHLQLETWQATVQSSTVGQALFDSFGQVLALNEPLQEMLEEERPLTLLEVLGQVTAVESERLQESLRDLIFERRPQSFWVHGLGSEARQITLRPIIARRSADRHPFVIPFDVQAVFLEVLDGRAIEERVKARESAARSTLDVADELLADVESIACDLDVESMLLHAPDHALDRGPDFLPRTLRQVRGALEQSREFLARPITDRVDDRVPVDMAAILQESIDRVRQSDRGALVCWQVRLPDRMPPVHANPHRLKILLDELWAILIGDPMADAQAAVVGRAGVDSVTVRIQVSGFANSLGQLIDVLPADQPGALAGFRRMDDLQQWVRVWNGRLEVDSQAGQVLIVTLQLPAFQVTLSASESVRG